MIDLLFLIGVVMILVGVYLLSKPLSIVVCGLFIVIFTLVLMKNEREKKDDI